MKVSSNQTLFKVRRMFTKGDVEVELNYGGLILRTKWGNYTREIDINGDDGLRLAEIIKAYYKTRRDQD